MVTRDSYALCMQNSDINEVIVRTLARLPFVPEAASSQPTLVTTNGPVQTFLGGTTRSLFLVSKVKHKPCAQTSTASSNSRICPYNHRQSFFVCNTLLGTLLLPIFSPYSSVHPRSLSSSSLLSRISRDPSFSQSIDVLALILPTFHQSTWHIREAATTAMATRSAMPRPLVYVVCIFRCA